MAYNVYTHKRRTFLHIRSSSDDQITQIIFRIHIYSDSWPIIRFFHHITDYLSVDGLWQTESEIDVESAQETEEETYDYYIPFNTLAVNVKCLTTIYSSENTL